MGIEMICKCFPGSECTLDEYERCNGPLPRSREGDRWAALMIAVGALLGWALVWGLAEALR